MEDPHPVEDWIMQEYSSDEQRSKLRWILNKGLSVGKKILITGFVISTAPLVLPLLVTISVIGFACSVPSGILLASYACTDKLMSKLLPGCKSPPFSLEYETVYNDEEVVDDESGGVVNLGLKGESCMGKEEEEEEKKPVGEGRSNQVPVDELQAVVVNIVGDEISGRIEEEEASVFEASNVVVEACDDKEIEEDEELMRETRGLLERIKEEGMTDNKEDDKRSLEELSTGTQERDRQIDRKVEPLRGSKHKIEENKHDEISKESAEKQERGHMENVEEDTILNTEKETVISTNADAREIADESGFDLYDKKNVVPQHYSDTDYNDVKNATAENEPSLVTTDYRELPVSTREYEHNGTAGISSQKDFGMDSSKVLYSEKKMWEQINAVRQIVGYKAAKQATCFEELKALYLFTGVEPPASFKDPYDLAEINDKLWFLMSIVGVK